jgi:hypothetical protein
LHRQVLAELIAMGVDVAKQDAKAHEWYEQIQASKRRQQGPAKP